MEDMRKKPERGILVVSFGTSYQETCKKTIQKIEDEIREAYPENRVYRAWTSGMIRRKVLKRDGICIPGVEEALEQMKEEGVEQVVVQPTHVINGIENDEMIKTVMKFQDQFQKISIGAPLLTSQEDQKAVIKAVLEEMQPTDEEMLIFMGHGTEHHSNAVYAALNFLLKDLGHENTFIATVEAYPSVDHVVKEAGKRKGKNVRLVPFMLVAGDHANHDLAGEEEDSWKSILEKEGYRVTCDLKGLGEYPGIRRLYMEHLKEAVGRLQN